ncbi:MAG: DoxX family protein [Burkholderiales bacterium]|jgi:putative oxidoreductase|nr:DoxX family protein [Burkholderiales bacterium]
MNTKTPPHEFEHLSQMASSGKLLLRVVLGLLILLHGIAKMKSGVGPVMTMLTQHGLPGALAYLVYIGEVVAPLLLIVGIWTRVAAVVIAVNMLVAVGIAHMPQLLKLGEQGGYALELQAMYLFGALAVMLLGAGRYSAGGAMGRWN